VIGALWWDRRKGLEQIEHLQELRADGVRGRFAATSVKIMQDGVCENFTASMLDPYLDEHGHPTDNHGLAYIDPQELPAIVTALDAAGFQVHVHVIGDKAVRDALDAIDEELVRLVRRAQAGR